MKTELYPEKEIVEGCKKGERYYQELLYRRFAPKMYGVCLSYAKNRDQARDILHDAFLKIFRSIGSYKGQGSFEGWIRRIITNTAIDLVRQNKKDVALITEDIPETPEEEPTPPPAMKMPELLAQVARLPEGARMVFNLYALEGMTHAEIARRLDISVGTSKSQFNRARIMLQGWVNDLKSTKSGLD